MGLSSSQTRLLTLTSRKHSVEGKAQRLMADKLRMANHSDMVYQKYLNALDETYLKTMRTSKATGADSWVSGSLNNLLRYDVSDDYSGKVFFAKDIATGKIYVPERIATLYDSATDMESFVKSCDSSLEYNDYETYDAGGLLSMERVANNSVLAKYYEEIYKAIEFAGGYIPLEEQRAKNDFWVGSMIKSGQIILAAWDVETDTLSTTLPSLNTHVKEVADNSEIEKAAQIYEADLEEINKKETDCDKKLQTLESEREAISLEIDSLKKVMNENVERTFKLFS